MDHTTIWRRIHRYGPEVHRRLRGQRKLRSSTWHVDETLVRIARRWRYLFGVVDSRGQTVDFYLSETRNRKSRKCFVKKAIENPDNLPPRVFARDGLRSYPAAIRDLQGKIESDHRSIKRRLRAIEGHARYQRLGP